MNELFVLLSIMLLGNPAESLKLTGEILIDRNTLSWDFVSWSPLVSIQKSVDYGEYFTIYDSAENVYDDLDIEDHHTYKYRIQFNCPNFTMYSNEITLTR